MVVDTCASQRVGRLPVRERAVRAAEVRKLRHPEGTTIRRLPIELHARSRLLGRQQVPILPLGLHGNDVDQERSWPIDHGVNESAMSGLLRWEPYY